jgi:hypothetical protein
MALSNLRKSIFHLQQAIREDKKNKRELLSALDIMAKVEMKNSDVNDPEHYNTTDI